MSPFVDIAVRPAYGQHKSVVTWKVLPPFALGDFYVYRSYFNARDWELLTPEPIRGRNSFSDLGVTYDNQFTQPKYRIALSLKGVIYDSPVVQAADKLTMNEYRQVRRIMNIEQKLMDTGRSGIRVLLYAPLLTGTPARGVDPDTGQQFSLGNSSEPTQDCFGTPFAGGFHPPVLTWMKLSTMGPLVMDDKQPEPESSTIEREQSARILAYPEVMRGDLIIHPDTDNRYVVGESIQGYLYRGTVPIAYDIKLQQLRRTDPRCRVPVPEIPPDPRTA